MVSQLKGWLFPLTKELAYRTRINLGFFPKYSYLFSPEQLCFLVQTLSAARDVTGAVVEVGCADGATTVFLNEHMTRTGLDKPYACIDTFSGFTDRDISFELNQRGKGRDRTTLTGAFRTNKRKWFERTLANNHGQRVSVYEADAVTFDYTDLGPIAMCLLDLDLYLPVREALPRIYDQLSPGGIIVVDDCRDYEHVWDGAAQAYREFVTERKLTPDVRLEKLGIIHKSPEGD